MNKTNYPQIEDMFSREDQQKNSFDIRAFNSIYTILPGVFSPKVRNNSLWYTEKVLELLKGNSFLEIGAGVGILAIEVAKQGYQVVATDIDPQAIKNIQLNSDKHKIPIDVREGDIFEPLKREERFDTIFWNHPWIYSEEKIDSRHQVSFDYHYQALKKFMSEGKHYVKKDGQILLGTGSLARIGLITTWAHDFGYKIKLICREVQPLAVGGETLAEFFIYSLSS